MKKLIALFLSLTLAFSAIPVVANTTAYANNTKLFPNGITPKLFVTFDDESASNTVTGYSSGVINGNVYYPESFNGTKALHVENTFSKTAQQYVSFSGITLGNGNHTISFWYQGENYGGQEAWTPTLEKDYKWDGFKGMSVGGNIFANTDTSTSENIGLAVLNLPSKSYATYQISDGTTTFCESNRLTNGVLRNVTDSRWHNIVITIDRKSGVAVFYVDGEVTKELDISSVTGSLGNEEQNLVFGADGLGQYGVGNGNYDNIAIYDTALTSDEISSVYSYEQLQSLIYQVKNELLNARVGSRFDYEDIECMQIQLTNAYTALTTPTTKYIDAYNTLREAYLDFLLGNKPNQVMILTSDTHLQTGKYQEYKTTQLQNVLDAAAELPYPANTYINAGDHDENRETYKDTLYFNFIKENFYNTVDDALVVTTLGNHQFTHPSSDTSDISASGIVDTTLFKQNVSFYIDSEAVPNKDIVDGNGMLTKNYYYVTDGNVHYVVIDQFENSGAGKDYVPKITAEQEEWFINALKYCERDGKPIFVVAHLSDTYTDAMKKEMSKHSNLIYMRGHAHHGFGRGNIYRTNSGYFHLDTPSTFYERATDGFVGGGAYFAFVYDDCLVLRAYCSDLKMYMPEYDEVVYFNENDKLDYEFVEDESNIEIDRTETPVANLSNANAYTYGYSASVQNNELTQQKFTDIINSNTLVDGSFSQGTATYTKTDSGYTYNLNSTTFKVNNNTNNILKDGIMNFGAQQYISSLGTYAFRTETSGNGTWIGGSADGNNVSLKAAIADGLASEDRIYGILLFTASKSTEFDGFLLSTGTTEKLGIRAYDIYISDEKSSLFDVENKVFSYKQNKGMLNTASSAMYYDWDNHEFTTDKAFEKQYVTWGNAQYINFNGKIKPKGKYVALVARDAGDDINVRADIGEFRIFDTSHTVSVTNATASTVGYKATIQNTELDLEFFSNIGKENRDVGGNITTGVVNYTKTANGYTYDLGATEFLSNTSYSNVLQDSIPHYAAMRYIDSLATYALRTIKDGIYIGGTYGANNASLTAAKADGLPKEDEVYGIALYTASTVIDIDSILLSTGAAPDFTARSYDIYISDAKADLFENKNLVVSYKQNKGMINSSATPRYYDWETSKLTTDEAFKEQYVVLGNAQYIKFTGAEKPKGKYIAFVAKDAGSSKYPRVDLAEFRVFGDPICTVNFKDSDNKVIHTEYLNQAASLNKSLTQDELKLIENKIKIKEGLIPGRNITLSSENTYYWNYSYDKVISADTTYRAVYSSCKHATTIEIADDKYKALDANCGAGTTYFKACSICKAATEETFQGGEINPQNHVYDNACDKLCNTQGCGNTRDVPDHEYDNEDDSFCNICGFERALTTKYTITFTDCAGKTLGEILVNEGETAKVEEIAKINALVKDIYGYTLYKDGENVIWNNDVYGIIVSNMVVTPCYIRNLDIKTNVTVYDTNGSIRINGEFCFDEQIVVIDDAANSWKIDEQIVAVGNVLKLYACGEEIIVNAYKETESPNEVSIINSSLDDGVFAVFAHSSVKNATEYGIIFTSLSFAQQYPEFTIEEAEMATSINKALISKIDTSTLDECYDFMSTLKIKPNVTRFARAYVKVGNVYYYSKTINITSKPA